jgi:hypothetical protein
MQNTEFLIIFPTFLRLNVVSKVLPSIIEEVARTNNSKLMVIDNSIHNEEKRNYLLDLRREHDFFLLVSDNTSYAHARNIGLTLGQEMYVPEYICILDDDHGLKPGFIRAMIKAMNKYYGKKAPTGLRYGMFTSCHVHSPPRNLERIGLSKHYYPDYEGDGLRPFEVSGANGCCRVAPTHHWTNVLGLYCPDEYPISNYQASRPRWRNYHRGYTAMYVGNPGEYMFDFDEEEARGYMVPQEQRLWDGTYTKSDKRAKYKRIE